MTTCLGTLVAANILALLDQQKELEAALTADLDADEGIPESNCAGTQVLAQ